MVSCGHIFYYIIHFLGFETFFIPLSLREICYTSKLMHFDYSFSLFPLVCLLGMHAADQGKAITGKHLSLEAQ